MNTLLEIGVTNAIVATLLAVIVLVITRRWCHPAFVHALWVIVLVKLVTPPIVSIPWHWPQVTGVYSRPVPGRTVDAAVEQFDSRSLIVDAVSENASDRGAFTPGRDGRAINGDPSATANNTVAANFASAELVVDELSSPSAEPFPWAIAAAWLWLSGSISWVIVSTLRLLRFHFALRKTTAAPDELQQLASQVAAKLGVTHYRLRMTEGRLAPLVWPVGRPTVLVSWPLVEGLSTTETRTLLAHEFAHLRRRDHWVRWLEFAAWAIYWWHPVVWWARRMIHGAEEQACDAWAVWAFPNDARRYAAALFKAAQFASTGRQAPGVASGLGSGDNLKERIEHVMNTSSNCQLSRTAMLCLLLTVLIVLPLSLRTVQAADEGILPQVDQPAADVAPAGQVEPVARPASDSKATGVTDPQPIPIIQPNSAVNISIHSDRHRVSIHDMFAIDANGDVDLGPRFGRVHLAGLTDAEATAALLRYVDQRIHDPKVTVLGVGKAPAVQVVSQPAAGESGDEVKVLRDQVKFLSDHVRGVTALFEQGLQGGSRDVVATANYELARAQAELSLAEGSREQAVAALERARDHAEQAVKAVTERYRSGTATQEALFQSSRSLVDVQRELIRARDIKLEAAAKVSNSRIESDPALAALASHSSGGDSIRFLKKIVESKQQDLLRFEKIAEKGLVSSVDLRNKRGELEISEERLRQAMRALESRNLLVELAEMDYLQAVEANKKNPGSVSEPQLRRLQIMIQLAQAKVREIAE
jgi:beta-lactamase regulating signal transducer with metallopeptidase domain